MPKAWYCIPSARPAAEREAIFDLWRAQGYGIALWLDPAPDLPRPDVYVDMRSHQALIVGPYEGYARAVNALAAVVLRADPDCDWIVTGGDDVEPDRAHTADQIAWECSLHFPAVACWMCNGNWEPDQWDGSPACPECHNTNRLGPGATFGVMQPTGDRWADSRGAYIDRVAGSPWMGREWCLRANGGRGPLWPEFTHMFVDEHIQELATKLGVFWQRRDLIHLHRHALRDNPTFEAWPAHMRKWTTPEHWRESKAVLDRLRANDFQECMPI
jgi:hypothetical protein